jgi:hypothetical protein
MCIEKCQLKIIVLFFSIISVLAVSCQKDSNLTKFEIGNNLINNDLKISVCDTFSINLSTVQFDSIGTSGTDSVLVGRMTDDRLGKILSKCYFRVSKPSSVTIQDDDIYDSISLLVQLNGYSNGDTLKRQNWSIYRLSEEIKTKDNGYLFNNSSFKHDLVAIGTTNFKVYPSRKEKINIHMDHDLGKTLFDMVLDGDGVFESDDHFYNYFKGIVIEPSDPNMNTLLGISVQDTSVIMRVYAHRNGEVRTSLQLDFNIETTTYPFSQIVADRSNTKLVGLVNQRNCLSSTITNNEAYIQGGTGLMTRVDIPGLAKILEIENSVLMKAELILFPVVNSYEIARLPSELIFAKENKLNQIEYRYINSAGDGYLYGSLSIGDDLYNENTFYSIDITKYVKDELSDNYFEPGKSGLLLYYSAPGYLVTSNRIVLGDFYRKNQKAKLKLSFISYN